MAESGPAATRPTRAEIEHLAALAGLALDEAQIERLEGDLDAILAHLRIVRDAAPEAAAAAAPGERVTTAAAPASRELRADRVEPTDFEARALAAAPDRHGRHLRVPGPR
jgi:Asp-tRNA(Asn)/Glu-tRNA(Gln) amidotransferase C subunit